MQDIQKQSELNELITALSKDLISDEEMNLYADKFEEIYSDDFRHSYSSLTGIMLRMSNSNEGAFGMVLDNLLAIRESIDERNDEVLSKSLNKLYDHLSLENIRLDQLNAEYNQKISDLQEMIKHLEDEKTQFESTFNQKVSKMEEEASKSKTEVVTILSIFAAIVLTFMGGMSFTASTFAGITSASIYRLIAVEVICGLVIFNTISTLIYLVSRIVDKTISAKCKTEDCSCTRKCGIFNKVRKKYPLIFWFNMIMMSLLLIDVLAWCVNVPAIIGRI